MPILKDSRWMLISDAAVYLRVHPQTIRNALRRGDLKASRLAPGSGPFLLDRLEIDRLLERQKRILPPYRKGSRPWVARRHAANRRAA